MSWIVLVLSVVLLNSTASTSLQFPIEPNESFILHTNETGSSFLSLHAMPISPSASQLGGLPVRQSRGKVDMTGLCLDHMCKRYVKLLRSGVCDASFKCAGCELSSKFVNSQLTSQYCQDIAPPSPESIILTTGYFRGDEKVKGSMWKNKRETTRIDTEWATPDQPIDITHCAPDYFNEEQAKRIMLNPKGPPLILHVRLVLAVSIMKVQQHIWNPDVKLTVIYVPPSEDVTSRGTYGGGGKCRDAQTSVEIGPKDTKLKDGELANIVKSMTVPWDRVGLTPQNFEIRLECTSSVRNCDLSNYRFCFRVMCASMPKDVAAKILMLQEMRLNPPTDLPKIPEIPKELLGQRRPPPPPLPEFHPPPLPQFSALPQFAALPPPIVEEEPQEFFPPAEELMEAGPFPRRQSTPGKLMGYKVNDALHKESFCHLLIAAVLYRLLY